WLACSLGVFRVSHDELNQALRWPTYRMDGVVLGPSDGLRGLPRQREPFPIATRATDGRIWIATTNGVAGIDPTHLRTDIIPPPVMIETIRANDRELTQLRDIELASTTRSLEISYAALSLTDPERVQLRYKLAGYDRDWRGPTSARQVTYTNLPPRHYAFRG